MVGITEYSHFRPYLHSKRLRWSYGAIKGRKGAEWMGTTSSLPVPQMVQTVARAGYAGIYIDGFGYADHAAALESQLAGFLGIAPIVSDDDRFYYFSLGALTRKDVGQVAASPQVGTAVEAKWEGDFSFLETRGQDNWRWCGNSGVLRLVNKSKDTAWVRLNSTVQTAWPENAKVDIKSVLFADELVTNVNGLEWERVIAVPPGEQLITFTSNARKHPASGTTDSRVLVFRLYNFTLTRAEAPAGGVAPKPLMQHPIEVMWGAGAYQEETSWVGFWHWCSSTCEIDLVNPSNTPAHVRINMGISTTQEKPARCTINGPGISDTVSAVPIIYPLAYTVDLASGKNVLEMSCDHSSTGTGGPPEDGLYGKQLLINPGEGRRQVSGARDVFTYSTTRIQVNSRT